MSRNAENMAIADQGVGRCGDKGESGDQESERG